MHLARVVYKLQVGLISNEGQLQTGLISSKDMADDLTHGSTKSLREKLSARQYQSIHRCVKLYSHLAPVLVFGKRLLDVQKW
jgi:hypothetical protein